MGTKLLFRTVNAFAGSGKTYQALRWALTEAAIDRRKTVIVFKSKELIAQAYEDARAHAEQMNLQVPIKVIHSKAKFRVHQPNSVSRQIHAHLSNASPKQGEVLMITEAAFLNLQHWPKRYQWTIICDEIPDITPAMQVNLPENHHLLTQHLQLLQGGDKYSEIGFNGAGKAALTDIAENPSRDDVNKVLAPLAKRLVHPQYRCFVLTKQYETLINQEGDAKRRQLEVFALLKPSIFGTGSFRDAAGDPSVGDIQDSFKDVIIMGAGFDISLMANIWPGLDVRFEPHAELGQKLRYTQHSCGHRLLIRYVFEQDWSKYFAGSVSEFDGNEVENFEFLQQTCQQQFGDEPFAYLCNTDREADLQAAFSSNAQQLPNAPWGLNDYQAIHNVGILSALNPTPAHLVFLNFLCRDADDVRDALFHSHVYQAVMRCSLRDLKSNAPVKVVVPDEKSAQALASYFPGCRVEQLQIKISRAAPKKGGRPKLDDPKPKKQVLQETRKRQRALSNEIKRMESGGAVDLALMEKFKRECRSNNTRWMRLQQLVAQMESKRGLAAG
ncbi:DEAD/DEAH box helicase family protein [Phaeobacter inhibens]|uniref:DEAD/DEAH box helicase family protein n=1 Tax=Phaeobacter inhibens TaxID=221822 RepID=UPI00249313C5|nr:DEAD/DEAH box helicase family protein [Phaeobacter inhibens]